MERYFERVYAGLLGKVIGVYLGRPIEGWSYEAVRDRVGEVNYYLHDLLRVPLVVTDDDISGTLTFLRAVPDNGYPMEITPQMVGEAWMNYLVEERSTICWMGKGNLPAPTAYYNMKRGILPPMSGSAELNTKILSEQDGSQIFVDGWAMLCPGDPERAARYARAASQVAFDGEALYGAMCWAAMEAKAFDTSDVDELLDCGLSVIPADCVIARMIRELRAFHAAHADWMDGWQWLRAHYGYDRYPGACPIVPNHGVMILGLLCCQGNFHRAMMIENSVGWDTDCNAANLACLLGLMYGLEGIDAGPDWRTPVQDRLYNAVADGGQAVSDVAHEAGKIINYHQRMNGLAPFSPKDGARYHFEFPGSVQGWRLQEGADTLPSSGQLENVAGHSADGSRSLMVRYRLTKGNPLRVGVDTFVPEADKDWILDAHYPLDCSPAIYRGQTIAVRLSAGEDNHLAVSGRLFVAQYGEDDRTLRSFGERFDLAPGEARSLRWTLDGIDSAPIHTVGLELFGDAYGQVPSGAVYIDAVDFSGEPDLLMEPPGPGAGRMWQAAWVDACNVHKRIRSQKGFVLLQNGGRGYLATGANSWRDYRVESRVTLCLMQSAGIVIRYQGLRRHYALTLDNAGRVALTKHLNGERVLAEGTFPFAYYKSYDLALEARGNRVAAWLDGEKLFEVADDDALRLEFGGAGFVVEDGKAEAEAMRVCPAG